VVAQNRLSSRVAAETRQCGEWTGAVLWPNRTKQWDQRVRVDVARLKDVRQRIIDLALLTKPEHVAIIFSFMASFSFGDSGGLITNPDTRLNDQQLSPTALMVPEAGKRLSPQPRGSFGNAQKNNWRSIRRINENTRKLKR
jgi:hypothetical protein